jgi:hypothetical protein
MPTFKQEHFIARAIASLQGQEHADWELIIVDDGSPDGTAGVVQPFLADPRIRYHRLPENRGLGAALNYALAQTEAPLVAYLPSDDVYYAAHLRTLLAALDAHPEAGLAYADVRHHYNRRASGPIPGYPLQLVQVLHRRTEERWLERRELVTDDLETMYWSRLRKHGPFVASLELTCEWVDHPAQRHKIIQEPVGGINPYRQYYGVTHPLRYQSTAGNFINEEVQYRAERERPATPPAPDELKILLVGELAYNADRVLALEEAGHRLYGLWMSEPYWYNTVGPLPFGHVEDLPRSGWREAVRQLQPDVIYALLNWQAVPFAYEVHGQLPDVPFVWHFKEGPFICLEKGTWSQLVGLYQGADGLIYCSPEMQDWFETVVPGLSGSKPCLVLDGDLPRATWFRGQRSPLCSAIDGQLHTVIPGRPIGLHPHIVKELADQAIHVHFYGDFTHGQWREWIEKARGLAPAHLHLHANVSQEGWVAEFSQYDAGWLHFFRSENFGEIRRANWDDLNLPARMATLAAAGLPMLQRNNEGSLVATQTLARDRGLGLLFDDMADLGRQMRDAAGLAQIRANVWRERERFTFDFHVSRLVSFFREVMAARA